MVYSSTPRYGLRRGVVIVVGLLALALVGALVWLSVGPVGSGSATTDGQPRELPAPIGWLGVADGVTPDGTTVFSDVPAMANLDPELIEALQTAAADAARDAVTLGVTSGWRSAEYQQQLLRDAIAQYGSIELAARWVATPETSLHVSGDAVDIGGPDAYAWLDGHGAAYGLCRVYGNEPWHFELRPDAVTDGCAIEYRNPARDPRLR